MSSVLSILASRTVFLYSSGVGNSLPRRIVWWLKFFASLSGKSELRAVVAGLKCRCEHRLPEDVWQNVENIGGFLTRKEAGLLYWAARNCVVPGPVIELGTYEGRSTGVFALAGRQVCCVDAWSCEVKDLSAYRNGTVQPADVFARFQANLKRMDVENMVSIHRGLTRNIAQNWNKSGAILFVDAGHGYEEARNDISLWSRHLLPHGWLIVHDVLGRMPGVTRAAGELLDREWDAKASSGSAVLFARKQDTVAATG